MSFQASIIKNEYVFSVLTRILNLTVSIIQAVLVARYLGPTLKGNSAFIASIIAVGSIVITFGMHQAYPYYRRIKGKDKIFKPFMSVTYAIYGFYFAISIILSLFFDKDIAISLILMPLFGYSRVVDYVCLIENPNERNRITLHITVLSLFLIAILYFFTLANYFWMVLLLAFSQIVTAFIFTIKLRCSPVYDITSVLFFKSLFRFGFFPMLALLMTTLNYKIDVLMLKQYDYIDYAMIGVYSIGIGLADKIVVIPDTLKGVLVSKLSKGMPNTEVAKVTRLCFMSCLLLCLFILLIGKWAISFLYGHEYDGAYYVVLITSLGALFIGYFKLIAQYNIINRKQVLNVKMLLISIIVNVCGNILFVPIWGINGAAVSTSIGNLVCGFVFLLYFSKSTSIPLVDMIIIKRSDLKILKSLIK